MYVTRRIPTMGGLCTFHVTLVAGALRADAFPADLTALPPKHQGERRSAHSAEGLMF